MDSSTEMRLKMFRRNLERLEQQLSKYDHLTPVPPKLLNDIDEQKENIKKLEKELDSK